MNVYDTVSYETLQLRYSYRKCNFLMNPRASCFGFGWLVSWSVGWLVDLLVGGLVGWLICWSVSHNFSTCLSLSQFLFLKVKSNTYLLIFFNRSLPWTSFPQLLASSHTSLEKFNKNELTLYIYIFFDFRRRPTSSSWSSSLSRCSSRCTPSASSSTSFPSSTNSTSSLCWARSWRWCWRWPTWCLPSVSPFSGKSFRWN